MDPVDADLSDFFCCFASEKRGRNNPKCPEAALEPAPAVGRAERVGAPRRRRLRPLPDVSRRKEDRSEPHEERCRRGVVTL
ncbi:unnamed protein product, partial [Ixodes pacificus]